MRAEADRRRSAQPPEPWKSFLEALDGRIERPVDLHCIGGFAMTMQFGISRATADIDVLAAGPLNELATLQDVAGRGSELFGRFKLYVQPVPVVTYPENYQERLIRMWPRFELVKLRLFSLDPHDLALAKLERNTTWTDGMWRRWRGPASSTSRRYAIVTYGSYGRISRMRSGTI